MRERSRSRSAENAMSKFKASHRRRRRPLQLASLICLEQRPVLAGMVLNENGNGLQRWFGILVLLHCAL